MAAPRRQSVLLPHAEEADGPEHGAGVLPEGWQELKDKKSGKTYFYHTRTRAVQWERPSKASAAPAPAADAEPDWPSADAPSSPGGGLVEPEPAAAAAARPPASKEPRVPQRLLDQRLLAAVGVGDVAAIEELARDGADLNSTAYSEKRYAPLHQAVFFEQNRAVQALLSAGAAPDVRLPKSQGGYSPLHMAVQLGRAEAVRLLLEGGARVDCRANGPKEAGYTPLLVAVMYSETEIARMLLEGGANPLVKPHGANSKCPLDYAMAAGDADLTRLLKAHERQAIRGMQSDEKTSYTGTLGNTLRRAISDDLPTDQDRAMFEAARAGKLDEVEVFLARGADVNRAQASGTALHRAAFFGHDRVCLVLLRAGADDSAKDPSGSTALQVATENGRSAAARVLRYWAAAGAHNDGEVLKRGPLEKKGGFRTMMWQTRFFELGPNAVFYYKSEADRDAGVPAGGFRLDHVAVVSPGAGAEINVRVKPRRGENIRLFELRAAMPAVAAEWVSLIREARERALDAADRET